MTPVIRHSKRPACSPLAVLVLLPAMLASQAALAQEGTEPKGMPQLDFANPLLLSQVVWGAIIFGGFYVLCARWVLPMMGKVIESREASITGDLERARTAKAQADAAVQELAHTRHAAQATAQAALDAATQEAKSREVAAAIETNARLDAQLEASERQIAQARTQAMGALRQIATETAALVVTRLTGESPDQTVVQTATDRILSERAQMA